MKILGIHAGHDCGAAVVADGVVASAVNEERISRNKLSFGVPVGSIEESLRCAGLRAEDIDVVALESIGFPNFLLNNGRPWLQKALLTRGAALKDFFFVRGKKLEYVYGLSAIPLNLLALSGLPRLLMTDAASWLATVRRFGLSKKISLVRHADCHLASAYYTNDAEDALSICTEEYDGLNSFKIDAVRNGRIEPVAASPYPDSPGVFYSLVTRMMGFNQLLHCGKITGCAALGDPSKAYPLVEKLMWTEGMNIRTSPLLYKLVVDYARTKAVPEYFAGHTPVDLAAAFQKRLEDTISEAVGRAVTQTGIRSLVLSGGVHANVLLNQKLLELPGVESIYVHPGMSDAGTALGAALWVAGKEDGMRPGKLPNVFLGTDITPGETHQALEKHGLTSTLSNNISADTARVLAEGKIVIRVAGRMEYGPRALGNRSILYNCQDPGITTWLNHRLDRTEFMPFAPAVMAEHASRCFHGLEGAEYTSEFMTITFDCTDWMKENCPAVVHADGTARPQIVTRESNPGFHAILEEYHKITGIPVLINTSYNIHNEPIVRTADDAIRVFKKICLDYLALGNHLVSSEANALNFQGGNKAPQSTDWIFEPVQTA